MSLMSLFGKKEVEYRGDTLVGDPHEILKEALAIACDIVNSSDCNDIKVALLPEITYLKEDALEAHRDILREVGKGTYLEDDSDLNYAVLVYNYITSLEKFIKAVIYTPITQHSRESVLDLLYYEKSDIDGAYQYLHDAVRSLKENAYMENITIWQGLGGRY